MNPVTVTQNGITMTVSVDELPFYIRAGYKVVENSPESAESGKSEKPEKPASKK